MGGGRGGPIRSTGAEGIEDSVVVTTLTVASHLKKKTIVTTTNQALFWMAYLIGYLLPGWRLWNSKLLVSLSVGSSVLVTFFPVRLSLRTTW